LLVSYIGIISYVLFRRRDKVSESVKGDRVIYTHEIFQAIKKSFDATKKYQDILLKENKTTELYFDDLKNNIVDYFKQMEIEKNTRVKIHNIDQVKLNTGLPISFFYQMIYSLICNVFYCGENREISIEFCCGHRNRIKSINIVHGDYSTEDRIPYVMKKYPEDILRLDEMKTLFDKLEIKIEAGNGKLNVIFPSNFEKKSSNVIRFKKVPQRHLEESFLE